MKKSSVVLLLLIVKFSFAQKQVSYNAQAAAFDMLNGKTFAELELEDTAGNVFHTSSLLGKTVYVDFWFTACAPCVDEIAFSNQLQQVFAKDTDVVFLCICIESTNRKPVWKQMVKEKEMQGIQLFYARNRPQKINLLREYKIIFPTYILVNTAFKVIGYNAPRPSQQWTCWAIEQARHDVLLSEAYKQMGNNDEAYRTFITTRCN